MVGSTERGDRVPSKWLIIMLITYKSHGYKSPFSRLSNPDYYEVPDHPFRYQMRRFDF